MRVVISADTIHLLHSAFYKQVHWLRQASALIYNSRLQLVPPLGQNKTLQKIPRLILIIELIMLKSVKTILYEYIEFGNKNTELDKILDLRPRFRRLNTNDLGLV